MTHFKEGGKGKLIIPAHLAYGGKTVGKIPAGSVLIFDIELIAVNFKEINEAEIQTYLAEKKLTAEPTGTGLYYSIDTPGTSTKKPSSTDNVTVNYKGRFLNGDVFDEGSSSASFNLKDVIKGFSEGLMNFNEGDSGVLYIPAHLAYGNQPPQGIKLGAVLIFDITLKSINK